MQDDERRRVEAVGRTNLDITERKRAEEAVRSSEEQLRLALKGANAAAWKWNIETGEATWSPEVYVLHGRDPETVPPSYDEWLASVHPEDRERVRANVRNALESGGSAYGSEYRVQLLSGEIRWIIALGTIERSREGAPLRMSGIDLHITQAELALRTSETALRQSQARMRHAADAARLTYAEFDFRAGRATAAENYASVMGYAPVHDDGVLDVEPALSRLWLTFYLRIGRP